VKTVVAKDLDQKTHVIPLNQVVWRPSAYGIIIKNGKILLCPNSRGGWELPGGGVEIDEDITQAVEREVREETGLAAKFSRIVATRENFFYSDEGKTYHSILFACLMKNASGKISASGFDDWEKIYLRQAEWVNLDKIDELKVTTTIDWREAVKELIKEGK